MTHYCSKFVKAVRGLLQAAKFSDYLPSPSYGGFSFIWLGESGNFNNNLVEYHFWQKRQRNCRELDLSNTGKQYVRIPLRLFEGVLYLDLEDTEITSKHIVQIAKRSQLHSLNVAKCWQLNEEILFKCKNYFGELSEPAFFDTGPRVCMFLRRNTHCAGLWYGTFKQRMFISYCNIRFHRERRMCHWNRRCGISTGSVPSI